ncbi:MAG TPA: IclR family transcriptional regulator [Steroidobacter sp.]
MAKVGAFGQGIRRVNAVLQALGRGPRSGLRLTDVALETKLNKATTHRLLSGLCEVGLVEQDEATGQFHLSFEMFVLGSAAMNRYGLAEIARTHLTRLESKTSDTVYLSVRSGFDAVCIDRYEGSYPVKVLTLNIGDRRPLGIGGGGLALLSFMPDAEIEKALAANRERLQAYPGITLPKLRSLIETTRRNGYSFFDGLVVPEMSALGVPIIESGGRVIAAMGLAAIRDRMKAERRAQLVEWMKAEAKVLEAKLSTLMTGLTETGVENMKRIGVSRAARRLQAASQSSAPSARTKTARGTRQARR